MAVNVPVVGAPALVLELSHQPEIARVNDGFATVNWDVDAELIAIEIPADWTGGLVFYCGAMSDWDVTYFNGTVIGRTGTPERGAHGAERQYAIPAEIVKPGAVNTIAVQVFCHGHENGLWRGPVFIARAGEVVWARETGWRVLDSNFLPPVEKGANAAN